MTGTGTAGSGGTIRHKTGGDGSTTSGIGIYLNATMSPSLSRMQLDDFDNFAIRGTGVNGFSLANSTVDGANGTSTGADEGSVIFDGLTGTTSITSNTIKGSIEDNVRVRNSSGNLDFTATGNTIRDTSTVSGNDNLILEAHGTATETAHVQNNTFAEPGQRRHEQYRTWLHQYQPRRLGLSAADGAAVGRSDAPLPTSEEEEGRG